MGSYVCRACSSQKSETIIDLGFHPIADTFLLESHLHEPEQTYPLRVMMCGMCGYAGLEYVVSSETRYQLVDYSYTSGNSAISIEHFTRVAAEISEFANLLSTDLVVDVGSNDGTLLRAFQEKNGCVILGVEPASNIAEIAEKRGIPTIVEFFNDAAIPKIIAEGQPKVIVCANVLNHASDLIAFVATIRKVLRVDGLFVFEVPYLLDLVEKTAFDTIYLEHVSYFGIKPLQQLFAQVGYSIVRIERTDYMGGSLRVYVGNGAETPQVGEFIQKENDAGLYGLDTYGAFMHRVQQLRIDLCQQLYEAKANGKKIVGIGAATKGNTLLNYCKIDSGILDFITDVSDLKTGKYTPGSHVLIRHDEDLDNTVDVALILPWNIAGFLMEKLKHMRCAFIVPHADQKI